MGRHHSLQRKILQLSFMLLLLPLSVYLFFMVRTTVSSARKNFEDYTVLSMRKVGALVNGVLADLDRASLLLIGSQDIRAYLTVGKEDMLEFRRTDQPANTYNILRYLKNTSPYIHTIQVLGFNESSLLGGPLPMGITQADADRALALNGRAYWDVDEDTGLIYLCRLLRNPDHLERKLGYIKIYLNNALLSSLLHQEGQGVMDGASYYLTDGDGNIRFAVDAPDNRPSLSLPLTPQNLRNLSGSSYPTRLAGDTFYLAPYTLEQNGWSICGIYHSAALNNQIATSVTLLAGMTLAAMALCILLAFQLSRRILGPLWEVVQNMHSVEEENFNVRIAVRGEDEVSILATQFNRMAAKISSLIDEVYKVNLRKKEADLRALQAQVNPHFLYNTLDMIYWTAKGEHSVQTGELISALSKFFRSALSPTGDFTTVHNEVEHLRYYVILRQQSKGPVDFRLELDPEVEWCTVVKLVLQPLVENALIHGVGERKDGVVEVSIFRRNDLIVYRIRDNGPGIDPADIEQLLTRPLESTRGFGIQNVNDRIQLAYGPAYRLYYTNRPEGGAEATVVFPFIRGETGDQADDCR